MKKKGRKSVKVKCEQELAHIERNHPKGIPSDVDVLFARG